jgi:hypothetical protein
MYIKNAEYITGYQLRVWFTDGTNRIISLYSFLNQSKNHLINKYLNLDLFKQFRVEDGALCWGDNEFDLNPVNIYKGDYDLKKPRPKEAVFKEKQA